MGRIEKNIYTETEIQISLLLLEFILVLLSRFQYYFIVKLKLEPFIECPELWYTESIKRLILDIFKMSIVMF